MPRAQWLWAAVVVASTTFARPARASSAIAVVATVCDLAARDVKERATRALEGRHPGFYASVMFEEGGPAVRVTIAVSKDDVPIGETVLVVSTCEEAADAAVVVLGLAFRVEPIREEPPSATPERGLSSIEPPRSEGEPELRVHTESPRRDASITPSQVRGERSVSRLSLGGGLEFGTLPAPSAFVSASFTQVLSGVGFGLRASLRYGLPTEDEQVEADHRESVRRDHGALGVSACPGLGVDFRLLVCAGGEVALLRVARRLETEGAAEDEDELSPRVSGVLGTVLSRGRGWIRPELEVFGAALAFGRRQDGPRLAVRAAAGAVVDF
jgi:hypothetical protein